MTQSVALYSGFRLHVGGPYPTSRALEARARQAVAALPDEGAPLSASAAARYVGTEALHSASIPESTGRAAGIGGLTSVQIAGSGANGFAANHPLAAEAYREVSEAAKTP